MRAGLIFLASSALAGFACQMAWADKLPKDAVKLKAAEVKAIYSGTTGVYGVSSIYYAPDGTIKGIFEKPNGIFGIFGKKVTSTFKGTWQVNGNEICARKQGKGAPKVNCNKFWRTGKKLYTLWSTHADGSKPDTRNGYYTNELRLHKKGDLVSKKYAAAGGE